MVTFPTLTRGDTPFYFHILGRSESALRQGLLRKPLSGFAVPPLAAYGVT